jgi:hypothetical protein
MATSPSPPHPLSAIQRAIFSYFSPQARHESEKAYEILPEALSTYPPGHPASNLVFEDTVVEIEDIRGREQEFRLDEHGFCFLRCTSLVRGSRDREEIEERYLPEIVELIKRKLGGKVRVVIFGWKVRFLIQNLEDGH